MFGVVDRIEEDLVVVEDDNGEILHIERHLLPEDIAEGDVLDMERMEVDEGETLSRKAQVTSLLHELFEDEE